jgi:gag-polyprotein putative aspartyl protease
MPLITQPYDTKTGPYIDVFLSKPESVTFRKSEIEESTRKLTMLIDSGASKTAISSSVAQKMGLLPIGRTPLKSATNEVDANIFYVDLRCHLFTPTFYVPDMKVVEFKFANGWIDGFLGRDFLERVVFNINGPEQTFTIST